MMVGQDSLLHAIAPPHIVEIIHIPLDYFCSLVNVQLVKTICKPVGRLYGRVFELALFSLTLPQLGVRS